MMPLAKICVLPVAFMWGLMRYISGWNNVSKTADLRPSGLGTGWICVIFLVIVAAIFLINSSEQVLQFFGEYGFGILAIILIFLTLYLKGYFSGRINNVSKTDLRASGLGTGWICVILLVFVTVIYPLNQQQ